MDKNNRQQYHAIMRISRHHNPHLRSVCLWVLGCLIIGCNYWNIHEQSFGRHVIIPTVPVVGLEEEEDKTSSTTWCVDHAFIAHDFLLNNRFFLPPIEQLKTKCKDSTADQLLKRIQQHQNPQRCFAREQVVFSSSLAGFGSFINSKIKPFMMALEHNLVYWSPGLARFSNSNKSNSTNYNDKNTIVPCPFQSMACWFQHTTSCETQPSLLGEETGCRDAVSKNKSNHLCMQDDESVIPLRNIKNETRQRAMEACHSISGRQCILRKDMLSVVDRYSLEKQGNDLSGYPKVVPEEFRSRGLFWYYAQLLAYLLRPNEAFQNLLIRTKKSLDWENKIERPLLSLHVRHGDSCVDGPRTKRTCDTLASYMERILPVTEKYGIRSIFLATDDEQVIHDTSNYSNFTWIYQPLRSFSRETMIKWDFINRPDRTEYQLNHFFVAQETLVDIFLLAEGNVLAGKFTSNIDRIAYALLVNRVKGIAPYLSLDSNWCFDWGVASGQSDLGNFEC